MLFASFDLLRGVVVRWIIPVALGSILAGCSLSTERTGEVARNYARGVDTIEIALPDNAPSISNNYRPDETRPIAVHNQHLGVDIMTKPGHPVIAPADGEVLKSFVEPMYGNTLVIDHGTDRNGRSIRTVYKHLRKRLVEQGDKVRRGDEIGELGTSGLLAAGMPHLHFEVHEKDDSGKYRPQDPNLYWAGGPGRVVCYSSRRYWSKANFKATYPVTCD